MLPSTVGLFIAGAIGALAPPSRESLLKIPQLARNWEGSGGRSTPARMRAGQLVETRIAAVFEAVSQCCGGSPSATLNATWVNLAHPESTHPARARPGAPDGGIENEIISYIEMC